MANSKISALTSASTPLAGTETLPVVQSSTTKKVSVANLTVGRAVSALSYSGTATSDLTFAAFASGAKGWQLNGSASAFNIYITGTSYSYNSIGASESWLWNYNSALNIGSEGSFETRIVVGGSSVLRAQTTGDVKIDTGNLVQGTAAKGINFTANTPQAGMSSQLLNWYEEGTWTPTQGAGLTVVGAFSSNGKYVKIGKQVTVTGFVAGATSVALAAGTNLANALPFTASQSPVDYSLGSATNATNSISTTVLTSGGSIFGTDAILATTKIYFTITYISV